MGDLLLRVQLVDCDTLQMATAETEIPTDATCLSQTSFSQRYVVPTLAAVWQSLAEKIAALPEDHHGQTHGVKTERLTH